jgi:hypothetical protein
MAGMNQSDQTGEWFRPPTRREHWLAGVLFVGFAGFFVLLFVVLAGWWFRWVILALACWSLLYALGHLRDAVRAGREPAAGPEREVTSHEPS